VSVLEVYHVTTNSLLMATPGIEALALINSLDAGRCLADSMFTLSLDVRYEMIPLNVSKINISVVESGINNLLCIIHRPVECHARDDEHDRVTRILSLLDTRQHLSTHTKRTPTRYQSYWHETDK
jgi:hypothetical protein